MNRRKFIAAASSTSTLTFAGCAGTDSTPEENQSETQTDDTNSTTNTSTQPSGDFFDRIEFTQTGTIEVYTTDTATEFSGVDQVVIADEDGTELSKTSFNPESTNMVEFSALGYRGDIRFQARNSDEATVADAEERGVVTETDTYSYRADVSVSGADITPVDGALNVDSVYAGMWTLKLVMQNDGNAPQEILAYSLDGNPLPYLTSITLTRDLYNEEDEEFVALPNTTTTALSTIEFEKRYGTPEDGEYQTQIELGDPNTSNLENQPPEPVVFDFTGTVEGELYTYPETVSVRLAEPTEE